MTISFPWIKTSFIFDYLLPMYTVILLFYFRFNSLFRNFLLFIKSALRSGTEGLTHAISNELERNPRFKSEWIVLNESSNGWTVLISCGTANTIAAVTKVLFMATHVVVSFVVVLFLVVVAIDVADAIWGHCIGQTLACLGFLSTVTLIFVWLRVLVTPLILALFFTGSISHQFCWTTRAALVATIP